MTMDQVETQRLSFVVIVWIEEAPTGHGTAVWRGHVTQVATGERRYITSLDDIPAFIAPYLQDLGVTLSLPWRVRLWLRWLRLAVARGH